MLPEAIFMAYYDEVIADSPRVYLQFEETSGAFNNAGSLGGTTGTVGANVTREATSKWGRGISITKGTTTGYIDVTTNTAYFTGGVFSVEAWFKTTNSNTNTIVQYNGSHYFVVSVAATGRVKFDIKGTGTAVALQSVTGFHDGNWHHVVATTNGTSDHKLYVDGTLVDSSTTNRGTLTTTGVTTTIANASSGATGSFDGSIDEFAIYNTALSSTRVAAHANYVPGSNVTNDVATVTATAGAVEPIVEAQMVVAVDVETATVSATSHEATVLDWVAPTLTASAVANDVEVGFNYLKAEVTEDSWVNSSASTTNYSSQTNLQVASGRTTYIKVPIPDVGGDMATDSATLKLYLAAGNSAGTLTVRRVLADWAEGTITASNQPAYSGVLKTVNYGPSVSSINIDIADIVNGWLGGTDNYGIALVWSSGGSLVMYSSEIATVASRPFVEMTIIQGVDISVDLETVSASAATNEVTVDTSWKENVATAASSAFINEVTVETEQLPDMYYDAETATGSADIFSATSHAPVYVDLATATSMAAPHEAEIEITTGQIVEIAGPKANATVYQLTDVNGLPIEDSAEDDPYFVSTRSLNPFNWFRLNERTGNMFVAYGYQTPAPLSPGSTSPSLGQESLHAYDNYGATMGLNDGPEGRHHIFFGGDDYMRQREFRKGATDEAAPQYNNTLEFTIRTTKKTQFIMGGGDTGEYYTGGSYWWLQDGRLMQRDGFNQPTMQGFADIADGKWHHVVIESRAGKYQPYQPGTTTYYGASVEFYIDGKLDIRRRLGVNTSEFGRSPNPSFATPDWVGGIPSGYQMTDWFVGDLTELVYYRGEQDEPPLSEDQIAIQRDNVMQVGAVRLQGANATASAPEPTVKGNKPRLLVLDFFYTSIPERINSHWDVFVDMDWISDPNNYSPNVGGGSLIESFDLHGTKYGTQEDLADAQVYVANVYGSLRRPTPSSNSLFFQYYWHEVTNEYRLIDLEKDLNLDDYDAIIIHQFPWNSGLIRKIKSMGGNEDQLRKIMTDIKNYVVRGGGLFVTDPNFAVEFGLVDDVEWVPSLHNTGSSPNQGEAAGRYDYTSWERNPWESRPAINWLFVDEETLLVRTGAQKTRFKPVRGEQRTDFAPSSDVEGPFHYIDTHSNNKQRVINLVPGLTDKFEAIHTDYLNWREFGVYTDKMFAYKYEDRENGLLLGDELYIPGMWGSAVKDMSLFDGGDPHFARTYNDISVNAKSSRRNGVYAAPMSAVRQGTVVTRFCDTIFVPSDGIMHRTREGGAYATSIPDIEVENPYRDYAVSIVLQPGQTLDGQQITGKVYCNFTEMPRNSQFPVIAAAQLIPENEDILADDLPAEYLETEETRKWWWSMWRGAFSGGFMTYDPKVRISYRVGNKRYSRDLESEILEIAQWRGNWPIKWFWVHTMNSAAWLWLIQPEDEVDLEGRAIVGVETARATGSVAAPTVEVQGSVTIDLPTLQAHADVELAEGIINPDVTVLVFAATATAQVGPFRERVDVASAMALASVYEEQGGSLATSDNLVLAMKGSMASSITLNMREEV